MSLYEDVTGSKPTWPAEYTICVRGCLDPGWTEWLGNMQMKYTDAGDSLLIGQVLDPATLHSLLNRIFNMNLLLLLVQRREER